jgi:hypothetical protein
MNICARQVTCRVAGIFKSNGSAALSTAMPVAHSNFVKKKAVTEAVAAEKVVLAINRYTIQRQRDETPNN